MGATETIDILIKLAVAFVHELENDEVIRTQLGVGY